MTQWTARPNWLLSSQRAADNLKTQLAKAIEHGATAVEVGEKVPTRGAFVQPTILTNVTPDNPAWYEEFFGPVSMIIKAKDDEDAIRIANDSHFGLGALYLPLIRIMVISWQKKSPLAWCLLIIRQWSKLICRLAE